MAGVGRADEAAWLVGGVPTGRADWTICSRASAARADQAGHDFAALYSGLPGSAELHPCRLGTEHPRAPRKFDIADRSRGD